MSEEEKHLIDILNIVDERDFNKNLTTERYRADVVKAINLLKDLYNQEKEDNKELEKDNKNLNILLDAKYKDVTYMLLNYISKEKIREKLELLKDILKAKEKDGNIYKQIPIEYLKGAIEQLEELLEDKLNVKL